MDIEKSQSAHNMTTVEKLSAAISANEPNLAALHSSAYSIAQRMGGWSKQYHYLFFKSWLDAFPEAKSVLIVGVYMGRDISFLLDAAKGRELQVVGVDKFSDTPCDDWPEDKKTLSWTAAGFGIAPNAQTAIKNIEPMPPHHVRLVESDDAAFLEVVEGKFDLIYLDTSHDKRTVERQLKQVRKLCGPQTIIAGDDYEALVDTWGVKEAVTEAFKSHQVLADVIWFASPEDYK